MSVLPSYCQLPYNRSRPRSIAASKSTWRPDSPTTTRGECSDFSGTISGLSAGGGSAVTGGTTGTLFAFSGGGAARSFVLDVDAFVSDARRAAQERVPVCIAGTAFAFVNLLDELHAREIASLPLPAGSRIMETGGFKGRSRIVARAELYAAIEATLGIAGDRIVAEYSMTELSSQWYDSLPHRGDDDRIKTAPPWLRARVVGADGRNVVAGIVGALVHVDLANRSSCAAVLTEDLGARVDDGIVLLGREQGAALRGCSLDAESLRPR